MNPQPKEKRIVNKSHLDRVKKMQCLICLKLGVDAHHLDSVGSGGSDFSVVPLCRDHHREFHTMGIILFEEKYKINIWRDCWQILHETLI